MIQRWTRKAQRHREVMILHWRGTEQQQQHGVCGEPSYSPSCYGPTDGRTGGRRVAAMDGDGQIYLSNRSEQPFASLSHSHMLLLPSR